MVFGSVGDRVSSTSYLGLLGLLLFLSIPSHALIIDARYDLEKAMDEYRSIFAPDDNGRFPRVVRESIKIYVNAGRGFNVGWLRLPRDTRYVDVRVTVYAYGGGRLVGRVSFNLFELNDWNTTFNINQELRWRQ